MMRSRRIASLGLMMMLPFWLVCNGGTIGGNNPNADGGDGDGGTSGCVNLQCQIPNCAAMGGGRTTLTGVVNIPAGNLPLYNATVYVPNSPPAALLSGASCDRCDNASAADQIGKTTTDVNGRFTLNDIPVGADIPLVISLGKWRRQIKIPAVQPCTANTVDATLTRLPKNQSEGDIPKIAVTTGGYDAIECLFRKLGIDDSEFTKETGSGRINLFAGRDGTNSYKAGFNNGATFTTASDTPGQTNGWWSKLDNLKQYDIVVLSCEGNQYLDEKSAAARAALESYINLGGRVFASHWHNVWMNSGSAAMRSIATFYSLNNSTNFTNPITANIALTLPGGAPFDKGNALADWMVNAGASPGGRGRFTILNARNSVASLNTALAQRYVTYANPAHTQPDEQYFSFFAPINAAASSQCGRMVFTDMHVSGNDANNPNQSLDQSMPSKPFPNGCVTSELSAQEKALVFLLFDLTNCVAPVIG